MFIKMESERQENEGIAKEAEEASQDEIDKNECLRQDLIAILGKLKPLKKDAAVFRETVFGSVKWFKEAASYLGTVHENLEKLQNSHKSQLKKLGLAVRTAKKEVAFLQNGFPPTPPPAEAHLPNKNANIDNVG